MRKVFALRVVVCVLLFAYVEFTFAGLDNPEWVQREERIVLQEKLNVGTTHEQTLTVQLRRIRRDGAQPVILSHAFVLQNKAMRELGHMLWEHGFDVWMPNARGHGALDELSKVEPYFEGDYSFDRIVTQDWPLVLREVTRRTQQKVNIIGYSMGGMSWEQFLSGVFLRDGHMQQSDALAHERAKQVRTFIGLVVPPDLSQVSETVVKLLNPLRFAFQRPYFVPLAPLSVIPSFVASMVGSIRSFIYKTAAGSIVGNLPEGIIEQANLKDPADDFRDLLQLGISAPHTDIINDFLRWMQTGYTSRDTQVNYAMNKKVYVPTLFISASRDSLAQPNHILTQSRLYPKEAHVRTLVASGYAHIDINFSRAIDGMSDTLLSFLHDPSDALSLRAGFFTDAPVKIQEQ